VLLVLIKKAPPMGRRLLVIGTSSNGEVMDSMGVTDNFNVQLHVPSLRPEEVVKVLMKMEAFDTREVTDVSGRVGGGGGGGGGWAQGGGLGARGTRSR
jgi:vesicle-fusing ATPase